MENKINIYLVYSCMAWGSDMSIVAVFRKKEDAKDFVKKMEKEKDDSWYQYSVCEMELL